MDSPDADSRNASAAVLLKAGSDHRTVGRMTMILEFVAANPVGVRLAALSEVLDAPKSSVFGLVKGLVSTGYLSEDRATYYLGPAVYALLDVNRPSLAEIAQSYLMALQTEYDETVMLATLVGDSVVYLSKIESSQLIRYSAPLRTRRPLWPTSTGKCLLAHIPQRRRDRLLRSWFVDDAERERVDAELAQVRASGVATVHDEMHPDVSATAGVILVDGKAVASIGVAGPSQRMVAKLPAAGQSVRAACDLVAARLRPAGFLPG